MLIKTLNNIITIARGDSGKFTIDLNLGTELVPNYYEMKTPDRIYFGVTEPNKLFEESIIKKVYSKEDLNEDGTLTIYFKPSDTINLQAGSYYYEIKLEIAPEKVLFVDGIKESEVHTIYPRKRFIITE